MPEQRPVDAPSPVGVPLSECLQDLSEALAAARTPQEVLGSVLRSALAALGAALGTAFLTGGAGDSLELAAQQGRRGAARDLPSHLFARDALARHEALFFEDAEALLGAPPEPGRRAGNSLPAASAVLPMFLGGQALGVLVLDFEEPRGFSADERRLLRTLAAQCAVALGHTRLLATLAAERQQRQQTELELRTSEARFRRMVEAGPVGIAAGALDGRLILVNDTYLKLLGYTRAEYEAGEIDWAALTPPEYHRADELAFAQAFEQGASDPYEKEMLTRTGERVPLNLILIRYEERDQQYVVGYLQDLRPFKAAERALREHGAELERQVAARTEELNARTRVLEAFETLSHELTLEPDPALLVGRAQDIVLSLLPEGVATYYEPEGAVWRLRTQTGSLRDKELQRVLDAGLPYEAAGNLRVPFETREPYYQEVYDIHTDRQPDTTRHVSSSATLPVVVGGAVRGVFGLGLFGAPRRWSAVDRALLETVARSLGLALERAEAARHLREQNAELAARTRALEGFAELTRDLSTQAEPHMLVRRAQEVMLSLLPEGYAAYYEPTGGQWTLRSQVGDRRDPAFQAHVEAGLPLETASLWTPWQTREPYYLEEYDQHTDHFETYQVRRGALAAFPVCVNGSPYGIFGVALFHERHWSEADRAVIETTVRSLGLALEGAQGVTQLAEERRKLAAANEELEAFAYSVSHDLRTPVRHIRSFNDLLRQALGDSLDEKPARYLRIVEEATGRMNTLIDAMLDLSRTSRLPLQMGLVDLGDLVGSVRAELEADAPDRQVEWEVMPLPLVTGDAHTLRQVLVNLLANALKYTRTREVARIEVWAEEQPHEWVVSVRDNGVGFDPRYGDKLFGVFQRLHRHDEFEGTGVGLANVRRIVTRHGGKVFAQGVPSEGATFGFTLPRLH
ncbi:adaptive-response sensory-kinase SasA [Deinococcus carri]|uniref:histidine kinase n=1 Tax=Deinococcus carri TaxID=1211323 RepID=A0ABP9W988_9DEIO